MRTVTKKITFSLNVIAASLGFSSAYGASIQNFLGINYSNAAALELVKHVEFIAGGNWLYLSNVYNNGFIAGGPVGTQIGTSKSHYPSYLPYGRQWWLEFNYHFK